MSEHQGSNEPRVMVSFSSDDKEAAQGVHDQLEKMNIRAWMSASDLQPGTPDWDAAIRKAIASSSAVILVATPSSAGSKYVKAELALAEAHKVRVIPVWMRGDDWTECVPLSQVMAQYIDCRGSLRGEGIVLAAARIRARDSEAADSEAGQALPARTPPAQPPRARKPRGKALLALGLVVSGALLALGLLWVIPEPTNEPSSAEPTSDPSASRFSGAPGHDVMRVQRMLTQLGFYEGPISGVGDNGTIAAVTAFQQENGLTPDGVLGQETWTKLAERFEEDSLSRFWGVPGRDVQRAQEMLAQLGFYKGPIDGAADGTMDAVLAFQQQNGLTPDGIVGPQTWATLQRLATQPRPEGAQP